MSHSGWYQIAFKRDLRNDLITTKIGEVPIVLRRGSPVRAYSDRCPHRGASLGIGGRLDGDTVICPFHGQRIGLGKKQQSDFGCVPELPCIDVGGLVFAATTMNVADDGFAAYMADLSGTHRILPGFSVAMKVAPQLVVENAFDAMHFVPVHGVLETPRIGCVPGKYGFAAEGSFRLPPSPWQTDTSGRGYVDVPFRAHAFGPTIVVSTLAGARPYQVITAACPRGAATNVFLSLAFPLVERATDEEVQYLLRQMKAGLDQDQIIWEHLSDSSFVPLAGDTAVLEFRTYAERFEGA